VPAFESEAPVAVDAVAPVDPAAVLVEVVVAACWLRSNSTTSLSPRPNAGCRRTGTSRAAQRLEYAVHEPEHAAAIAAFVAASCGAAPRARRRCRWRCRTGLSNAAACVGYGFGYR